MENDFHSTDIAPQEHISSYDSLSRGEQETARSFVIPEELCSCLGGKHEFEYDIQFWIDHAVAGGYPYLEGVDRMPGFGFVIYRIMW